MGKTTGISWTDSTWNAIRGCSRVSEGCRNCYAESVAHRFSGPGLPYEGLVQLNAEGKSTGKWNGQIKFVEKHLLDPMKWRDSRRIFVNSMSDLFHENVTDELRDQIFAVMALSPRHTFQILTKRPERMLEYLSPDNPRYTARRVFDAAEKIDPENGYRFDVDIYWPLSNVQLGVSVDDRPTADQRIPILLQTPAAIHFISAEPLLGPIELSNRVDWVIVGGESGRGARPMNPAWARSLRDQCKAASIPFFFKQWGAWGPLENGETTLSGYDMDLSVHTFRDDSKPRSGWEDVFLTDAKTNGCLLDGVEHHEFPDFRRK